jgi:hypothetical protein
MATTDFIKNIHADLKKNTWPHNQNRQIPFIVSGKSPPRLN